MDKERRRERSASQKRTDQTDRQRRDEKRDGQVGKRTGKRRIEVVQREGGGREGETEGGGGR